MTRPAAVAAVVVLAGLAGVFAWWRAPTSPTPTTCPDGGALRLGADGVASCTGASELPPGQALTTGQRFDCNTATADDLALVPGIGPALARELVAARDGGFRSWGEIDAVPGVGEARLAALQAACDIRVGDAGVW